MSWTESGLDEKTKRIYWNWTRGVRQKLTTISVFLVIASFFGRPPPHQMRAVCPYTDYVCVGANNWICSDFGFQTFYLMFVWLARGAVVYLRQATDQRIIPFSHGRNRRNERSERTLKPGRTKQFLCPTRGKTKKYLVVLMQKFETETESISLFRCGSNSHRAPNHATHERCARTECNAFMKWWSNCTRQKKSLHFGQSLRIAYLLCWDITKQYKQHE